MSRIQELVRAAMRSLYKWGIYALLVWLLLLGLLAGGSLSEHPASLMNPEAGISIAMRELIQWTIKGWVWLTGAVVVFLLLQYGVVALLVKRNMGRTPSGTLGGAMHAAFRGDESTAIRSWTWIGAILLASIMKFAAMFFAGFGALWCLLAGIELLNNNDPWESMPITTLPFLTEFQKRNPLISAERLPYATGEYVLHDGRGQSARTDKGDLAGSVLRLEACPQNLTAEQLGGITPYPGSTCTAMLYVRKADGTDGERVSWHFSMVDGDMKALEDHAKRLSDAGIFSGSATSRTASTYVFSAGTRDEAWHIKVNAYRGELTYIVIRNTPARPAGG